MINISGPTLYHSVTKVGGHDPHNLSIFLDSVTSTLNQNEQSQSIHKSPAYQIGGNTSRDILGHGLGHNTSDLHTDADSALHG